jgi:ABC-2 type transport system permease protein
MAKYMAGLVLVIFSILPTLIYMFSVYQLGLPKGNIDMGGTWGSYIGLVFLGAAFVAVGMFSSTLTDNQIVSFIIAVFISGFLYIGFDFIFSLDMFGSYDLLIKSLGINAHYTSMSRGVIDTRDVLYFLSIIAFFLLLAKNSLERSRS